MSYNPFLFSSTIGRNDEPITLDSSSDDDDDDKGLSNNTFQDNNQTSQPKSLFDTSSYTNTNNLWSNVNNNSLFGPKSTSTGVFNINNLPDDDDDDEYFNNDNNNNNNDIHEQQGYPYEEQEVMVDDVDNDISDELAEFQSKNASKSDDHHYYDIIEKELSNGDMDTQQLPLLLANLYRSFCESKLNLLQYQIEKSFYLPNKKDTERLIEYYQAERNTWEILCKLYQDRDKDFNEEIQDEDGMMIDKTSQVNIVQLKIKKDSRMRENIIILHWLEEMASDVKLNIDNVYWKNTLDRLTRGMGIRSQSIMSQKGGQVVSQVDPDAPQRLNQKIDQDDQVQEKQFLNTLWQLVRAGNRELAADFCRQVGQPWRAQTISGDRLFENERDIGNPFRNTWRVSCHGLSNASNDEHERAIYGLLGGNLPAVLPICRNWYDYLWAHIKVLVDEKINELLDNLPLRPPTSYEDVSAPKPTISTINTPKDILHNLRTNSPADIKSQSIQPYSIIQSMIIIDDYNQLVKSLFDIIKSDKQSPEFHRLAVIIILFYRFRTPNMKLSDDEKSPENYVINSYVEYLIENQKNDLVALYTSFLTNKQQQIKVYAKFLEGVTDQTERQKCLNLAERFGLETEVITETVVRNITQKKSIKSLSTTTQDDLSKIDAIGWYCFNPTQRIDAVLQSNKLLREFIELNKIDAAQQLIGALPKNTLTLSKLESTRSELETVNIIKEFSNWAQYLEAINRIGTWFQNYSKKPNQPTLYYRLSGKESYAQKLDLERRKKEIEEDYAKWNQNNLNYGRDAIDSIDKIIKQGWLCPDEIPDGIFDSPNSDEKQIHSLRVNCVPPLFFTLHKILMGTGMVKKSSRLVNIVADERFKWYNVFSRQQLQELLSLVQQSVYVMMEESTATESNNYNTNDYLHYSNYYFKEEKNQPTN